MEKIISVDPEIMSGMPVFNCTRVLVKNLFDYLETGDTLEIFLEDFPSAHKDQAIGILEMAEKLVTASNEGLNESAA